jgi:hypothetical protein
MGSNGSSQLKTKSELPFDPIVFCKTGKHTNENCNYIYCIAKKDRSNKYIGSEKFYLTNIPGCNAFDGSIIFRIINQIRLFIFYKYIYSI